MSNPQRTIRLGTRGSALARWQTDHIAALLRQAHPDIQTETITFTTRGDQVLDVPLPKVGGKGLFTAELEDALRRGEIDLAVHSLKDLPTDDPTGLTVGAIPARVSAQDVLVSRGRHSIATLPHRAVVGSSSHRRAGQLLHLRPDLHVIDIRGNVDTRVRKALDPNGPYDAIVLAQAGLARLGHKAVISEVLPIEVMLPAPGQGALAVQCRDDAESLELLVSLDHLPTHCAVAAERAFLAGLGGGCSVPVAAYGMVRGSELRLHGRVIALDGSTQIEAVFATDLLAGSEIEAAEKAGKHLAERVLRQSAQEILLLHRDHQLND